MSLLAAVVETADYITLGGKIIIALLALIGVLGGAWLQFVIHPKVKAQLDAAAIAAERQNVIELKLDEVLGQVRNSHETNLREDLDEKFAGVHRRIDQIEVRVDNIAQLRRT